MTPKQVEKRKVVEEVEVDGLYGDWIVHLKPGWCWMDEQGVHSRGFPPDETDRIKEELRWVDPCYCEDCEQRR